MTPVELLYKILYRFLTIPKPQIEQMENEAKEWIKENNESPKNLVGKMYKEHGSTWYVRTICAVLFIFLVRWVQDFMNPVYEDSENEAI